MAAEKTRILIADDDPTQRRLLRRLLEEVPEYEILEAEDGLEALNVILGRNLRPDLVLLDLLMPRIDGLEFLSIVRNKKELVDLQVIVCSIVEDVDTVRQAMQFGIRDFIAKPIEKSALHDRIANVLHRKK